MALQSDDQTAPGSIYESSRGQAGRRAAFGEETPEVLRRRADVLLDEMMVGSVDMGAGDTLTTTTQSEGSAVDASAYPASGPIWHTSEPSHGTTDATGYRPLDSNPVKGTVGSAGRDANGYAAYAEERDRPSTTASYGTRPLPPLEPRSARTEPESPLISAEDRYKQLATPPAANGSAAGTTSNSAVRRQSLTAASTMTVGVRSSSRTNLLPRSTDIDTTAVKHEINTLLTEVSTTLPPGHEAVERSRHLLSKAQNLIQSDPTRSAEVDYYLQQVRRILERTRQTQTWSDIYRHRMLTYLLGWISLALVVVVGIVMFFPAMQEITAAFFAISVSSPIVRQGPLIVVGGFVGALGAAIAMLFTMHRQSQREFGYFDRKYGLRSLLLPVLGLFFGLLLSLLWAVIFTAAGVNPAQAWWAVAVPSLLAFGLGFGQDRLYGAR